MEPNKESSISLQVPKKKHLSEEHKIKIGLAMKGRKIFWKDKISKANKGKKRSLDQKRKMSEISKMLGLCPPSRFGIKNSDEAKKKIREKLKGKKKTPEHIEKVRQSLIRRADKIGRRSQRNKHNCEWRYREWRRLVYERDKYMCTLCGVVGGKLNADHIKPWALFPELRYEINNGRTLCVPCHRKTDTYGRKIKRYE